MSTCNYFYSSFAFITDGVSTLRQIVPGILHARRKIRFLHVAAPARSVSVAGHRENSPELLSNIPFLFRMEKQTEFYYFSLSLLSLL
jgi:hypothetical protein